MKKAGPWIIGGIILIIIILIVLQNQSKKVVSVKDPPEPIAVQLEGIEIRQLSVPDTITDKSETPPVDPGASIMNETCVNQFMVVAMIKGWKEVGWIKRLVIENQLKQICPEALRYLIK